MLQYVVILLFIGSQRIILCPGYERSRTEIEVEIGPGGGLGFLSAQVQEKFKFIPRLVQIPPFGFNTGENDTNVAVNVYDAKLVGFKEPLLKLALVPSGTLDVGLEGGYIKVEAAWKAFKKVLGIPITVTGKVTVTSTERKDINVLVQVHPQPDKTGKPDVLIMKCEIDVPVKARLSGGIIAAFGNLAHEIMEQKIGENIKVFACDFIKQKVRDALDDVPTEFPLTRHYVLKYSLRDIIVGKDGIKADLEADVTDA